MESGERDGGSAPAASEGLRVARGHFRDAMGSVRNFAQLLHSVRVGPKGIESVLPDVHAACAGIEPNARTLLEGVAPRLEDRSSVDELAAWLAPRAAELRDTLGAALGKPVNAKTRLALDQLVTRLSSELELARALVDLLDESAQGGLVRLSLPDLLRHAVSQRDESQRIEICVPEPLHGEALVNPHVASVALGVAARWVAERSSGTPCLRLGSRGDAPALQILAGGETGERVSLPALPLTGPTLRTVEAAARRACVELEWQPPDAKVVLVLCA